MVAIRDDTHAALSLSLGRMLGVIAGVLLGIAVVAAAGVSTAAIVLLLVIGLAVGLFLRTGPELNTQIAISALLVVIVTKNADEYAVERIWETGVGSVVSLAVAAFLLPPDPLRECQRRLAATARGARGRSHRRAGNADERRAVGPRAARRTPTSTRARPGARSRTCRARCARCASARCGRSSRPRLEIVERRQRLALRLAIQVRRLARDFASFAHRDDLRDQWEEAARRLPPIIGLVAEAAAKALAGEGCSHEVAAARELMAEFQREDARPVSAILRRPARAAPGRARRAAGMSAADPARRGGGARPAAR